MDFKYFREPVEPLEEMEELGEPRFGLENILSIEITFEPIEKEMPDYEFSNDLYLQKEAERMEKEAERLEKEELEKMLQPRIP